MTAYQVQDYIDLLCSKVCMLGELYVARQLAWATAELDRVQAHQADHGEDFDMDEGMGQ